MNHHSSTKEFPAWSELNMQAGDCTVIAPSFPEPLLEEQVKTKIECSVEMLGKQTLSTAHRILIIVEDSSRHSRTAPLIEILLRILAPRLPNDATFKLLFAGGAHYGLEQKNVINKAPTHFPGQIITHNCMDTVHCGEIDGIPIFLNREVVNADLRIAIGTVNIHPMAGYSGGGKILVPGVAGLQTIFGLHKFGGGNPGEYTTPMRSFISAVLERHPIELGLQLISDGTGKLVWLSAGPLQQAWDEAIQSLRPYITRSVQKTNSLCIAESDPFHFNLLGIFKTLPSLISVMRADGNGLILNRGIEGLGCHQWRLDSEIILLEKLRWEEKLQERSITIISEALLDAAVWKLIFPRQLSLEHPGKIDIYKNEKIMVLENAPLLLIK